MTMISTNTTCAAISSKTRPTLWQRLVQFRALRQQRLHLARLDAHQLDDLGISATQAKTESARPVWDVPQNWVE